MPTDPKKTVLPLENQPPPGSVWEQVELARVELGWSTKEFAKRAKVSQNHYATIARTGWNSTVAVRDKFISALVEAGCPQLRFGLPLTTYTAKNGRLSAVRDLLYKRHADALALVNETLAMSSYIDDVPVNELEAFDALDQQIRGASAPLGHLKDQSVPADRKRFDRDASRLGNSRSGRRRKQARK